MYVVSSLAKKSLVTENMATAPSVRLTSTTPRTIPAGRPNFSRASRRTIRQAAAMASEANIYSFRTHVDGSITWVPHRNQVLDKQQRKKNCEATEEPTNGENPKEGEPSKRALKKAERARSYHEKVRKAVRFRCATIFRCWCSFVSSARGASAAPQSTLCDSYRGRGPGHGRPQPRFTR